MNRVLTASDRKNTPNRVSRIHPISCQIGHTLNTTILNTWLPKLVATGVTKVRFEFLMADIQPSEGVFTFSQYDTAINLILSYGIEVICLFSQYGMPSWAAPLGGLYNCTPAQYESWIYNTVLHFKGRIKYYEMGNEPNLSFFCPPFPNYITFTNMLKGGYHGAKSADPDCKVLSPGIIVAIDNFAPSDAINADVYLDGMLANGAQDYYDYLAIHPYAQPINNINVNDVLNRIEIMRNVQSNYGDTKHIWITELGWTNSLPGTGFNVGGVTQEIAANNTLAIFNDIMFANHQYVDVFNYYTYSNFGPTGGTNPENEYGLFLQDGTPKQVINSFQSAQANFNNNFIPYTP